MVVANKLKTLVKSIFVSKKDKKLFAQWEELYGEFDKKDYKVFQLENLPSESGYYHGEIVKWAADITPKAVLFVGENVNTATILRDEISATEVFTTGLSGADYLWNFEEDIPSTIERKFDLIVSQAIFEHLLNPYKHLQDLSKLLSNKGYIIIHTVMPGFKYHRYPIDSVRFFPDWFEEVAKRFNLKIINKRIRDKHIFYMYQN